MKIAKGNKLEKEFNVMLIKGKSVKAQRETHCGCMIQFYPLPKDSDLLDWLVVHRTMDMEEKWSMQAHKHKDFQEYWFVIEGKGQMIDGDKVYDVEAGDLCIMTRGVCHKALGDMTWICCTALHNVYGQTIGRKMQYVACDEPYRDNPADRAKVGEYLELDVAMSE